MMGILYGNTAVGYSYSTIIVNYNITVCIFTNFNCIYIYIYIYISGQFTNLKIQCNNVPPNNSIIIICNN